MKFYNYSLTEQFHSELADFEYLNSRTYQELTSVPSETIRYWKHAHANGEGLLWFKYIPHVFTQKPVPLAMGEIGQLSF